MTKEKTTCPYCKEEVNADAVKCKHCHSGIKPEAPEVPEHQGICPFCKEEIKAEAVKCKHCQSWVGKSEIHESHTNEQNQFVSARAFNSARHTFGSFGGNGISSFTWNTCDRSGTMWCWDVMPDGRVKVYECGSCPIIV